MTFLKKALQIGLSPANICSFLALEWMRIQGGLSGTLRLRLKAHLLGVELGRDARAWGQVGLLRWPGGKIKIGDNVRFISSWRRATSCACSFPCRLRVFAGAITIGDGCELTSTSITCRSTSIKIGKKVLIAPNCIIVDSDFHAPWPPDSRADDPGTDRDAPVAVGDHVWIGMRAIILKGVTIGAGAIIGAGSIVTRDIPEGALACGAPARVVKRLA